VRKYSNHFKNLILKISFKTATQPPYIINTVPPTLLPPTCNFCPNLPLEKKENCKKICSSNQFWNGKLCVSQSDCSCYVGHFEYKVGTSYQGQDCRKCTCTLGGVPQCQTKVCPPCKNPAHQSIMTPSCECVCRPCPEESIICPNSKVCVPKEQWCDGIDHCSDDEKNCTITPPRQPRNFYFSRIINFKLIIFIF